MGLHAIQLLQLAGGKQAHPHLSPQQRSFQTLAAKDKLPIIGQGLWLSGTAAPAWHAEGPWQHLQLEGSAADDGKSHHPSPQAVAASLSRQFWPRGTADPIRSDLG